MTGNGPLMLSVPTPEDEGVTTVRSFPLAGEGASEPSTPSTPPSGENGTPPSGNNGSGAPTSPPPAEEPREELEVSGYGYEESENAPPSSTRSMAPPSANARSTSKNGVHPVGNEY